MFLVLVACGGNNTSPLAGDGSGSAQVTSIPLAKSMGELSSVERKQLCLDFVAHQKKIAPSDDDQRKQKCAFEAAFGAVQVAGTDDAGAQAACKKSRDECIAKKEPVEKPEMNCNDEQVIAKMAECPTLTVAEMAGCVEDMGVVMKKFVSADLCSTLKAGDNNAITKVLETLQSPKCKALETKCQPAKLKPEEAAKLNVETVTALGKFSTQMCACKDKACSDAVQLALQDWSGEMQKKAPDLQPDPDSVRQANEHMAKYTECMTKLSAGAGSAKTGSGSAK
jgi:hypothetical protein